MASVSNKSVLISTVKSEWSVGDGVEIAGLPEEGFPSSWSLARILSASEGSLQIKYSEIINADSSSKTATFKTSSYRLRPASLDCFLVRDFSSLK
eukprot:gene29188-31088_t